MAGSMTEAMARANAEAAGPPWIEPADRRVGILGGTFDPIHYAHLAIGEEVREALSLDRVLFVPAGVPPHKSVAVVAPAADRAAMVELAIADNPAFAVCRIELERPGPSYTIDTLDLLASEAAAQGGGRDLLFILSAEALAGMPTWHDWRRILTLCRLAIVPRLGESVPTGAWLEANIPGCRDRFVFVESVPLAHSSSDVRRRVAAGGSIRYLVPPAVEAYVHDHRLYRSVPEDQRK